MVNKRIRAARKGMVGKKKASKRGMRTPIGKRVTVLMMIDPEIAADMKAVAMEEKRAAWSVMEDAAREYLERRRRRQAKP